MAASYPAGYDTMDDPGANLSGPPLHSTMHNQINDVIEAIEAELGINPSGADATVAATLAALSSRYAPLARGWAASNSAAASTSGITVMADVITVTFTAVAARRYRISFSCVLQQVGSTGAVNCAITDNANNPVNTYYSNQPVNSYHTVNLWAVVTPGAGSVTYKGRVSCTAGTITLQNFAPQQILVEDDG